MKLRANPRKTEKALEKPASPPPPPTPRSSAGKVPRRNSTSATTPVRATKSTPKAEESNDKTEQPETPVKATSSTSTTKPSETPELEKRKTRTAAAAAQSVASEPESDENDTETVKPSEAAKTPSTRTRLSKTNASEAAAKMEDVAKSIVNKKDAAAAEEKEKTASALLKETKQAAKAESPDKAGKRPERATVTQAKRKAAEPAEDISITKRPRVARVKSREAKDSESESPEDKSFELLYNKVKDLSTPQLSDKWSFSGVQWDPSKSMRVFAASEVDLSSTGNMRLRRSVQVFDNMTTRVIVEGTEMTPMFSTSPTIKHPNEVSQLIAKVCQAKICAGIKNFGATDKVYFPQCVLRGEAYFAPECPVVMDATNVGPLCSHCSRMKNMIQRRNVKETSLLYSKFSRAPVKNVRSGFGKQLYSMLTDMVEAASIEARKERKKLKRMVSAKEYPFSDKSGLADDESYVHIGQHGGITISSLSGNAGTASSGTDMIRLSKAFQSSNGQTDVMTINVLPGQRGTYKVTREAPSQQPTMAGGNVLTASEMQMVEQLVLQEGGDVGNVIIQNSNDFSLAEGQEYELIGETDTGNNIQVLEVGNNDDGNTIEIIEVDDQTLAQLTSQSVGNYIIQDPSAGGYEVQEIDSNDPNFRNFVKSLNPNSVVYQS